LDVVLLDEPTASMDIAGTLKVEAALASYRERSGCLLVVATHAPSQARRIAERAVMLSSGSVVEQGSTEGVLTSPESPAGREFLSYWTV
jgi:ABC-type phosphate transport system ATPase subunit